MDAASAAADLTHGHGSMPSSSGQVGLGMQIDSKGKGKARRGLPQDLVAVSSLAILLYSPILLVGLQPEHFHEG
jgi:hypothetical protein